MLRIHVFLFMAIWSALSISERAQAVSSQPVSLNFFGIHFHDPHEKTSWPTIKIGSWRLWDARVSWPHLEPQHNNWQFRQLDSYVSDAKHRGMSLLLPLGLSPTWAASKPHENSAYKQLGWASPPKDITDWEQYVERVMRRYRGRIQAYEIWNEPNLTRFYSGSTTQLVEMTCAAMRIRDAIDPGALIVSPAATEKEKGISWLRDFLELGGGKCIDVIGFHFYLHAHEVPEQLVKYLRMVKEVRESTGLGHLPIWNTESGWYFELKRTRPQVRYHIVPYEETASYVMRAMVIAASEGIERFYWYAWNNGMMGGLVEVDTKELALGAKGYQALMKWILGHRVSECVVRLDVWRCPIDEGDEQSSWVAWSSKPNSKWLNESSEVLIEKLDATGGLVAKTIRRGDSVTLTQTPILVKNID